jgi:L-alanine-DL-glutamate epimerase-like enolase superfamily enzyme
VYIDRTAAPYLLGKDPLQIERHWSELCEYYLWFASVGTENQTASAIGVEFWDFLGQAANLPLYELLGGQALKSIASCNAFAGDAYARRRIR